MLFFLRNHISSSIWSTASSLSGAKNHLPLRHVHNPTSITNWRISCKRVRVARQQRTQMFVFNRLKTTTSTTDCWLKIDCSLFWLFVHVVLFFFFTLLYSFCSRHMETHRHTAPTHVVWICEFVSSCRDRSLLWFFAPCTTDSLLSPQFTTSWCVVVGAHAQCQTHTPHNTLLRLLFFVCVHLAIVMMILFLNVGVPDRCCCHMTCK